MENEFNFDNGSNFMEGFESVDSETSAKKEAPKKVSKDKEEFDRIRRSIVEEVRSDPEKANFYHSKKDTVEIVNSLAFPDNKGLVPNGTITKVVNGVEKEVRQVSQDSSIVGFVIKNVGDAPLDVVTSSCKKAEDGSYVVEDKTVTVNPGDTLPLAKAYLAMLGSRPEFSCKFKNASFKRSSGAKNAKTRNEILNAITVTLDGGKSVRDDAFLRTIAKKTETGYEMAPEYMETFAFLLNAPKASKSKGRAKGINFEVNSAAFAAFLRESTARADKIDE